MVIDDTAELGLPCRLTMDCVMWAIRKLDWNPASHLTNPPASPMLASGPSRGRMTSFPTFPGTTQAAEYVRDNLRWSVRESSSLRPNLLPLHFMAYCPEFDHIVEMQFAHTVHVPEMVPRLVETVYNPRLRTAVTSRLRDAPPFRVMRSSIKMSLPLYVPPMRGGRERKKREVVHFQNFTSTEMAAEHRPRPLPEDHLILCLSFKLGVATRYAKDSNIPEMVQVIFYAMVMKEVAERNITCKISAGCLMWACSSCIGILLSFGSRTSSTGSGEPNLRTNEPVR
ncbi:hypothetical protein Cgig2_016562 [Carnegiea gigantea]|uniref:Uncharacterized protein n=1 Tax=Carnegiea gigantea TaxID=171969 RepID=A0A9Q1QSH3_9CARY|nr:hypothetical protein Cgig2_016562 [Carnegiea gigantea]